MSESKWLLEETVLAIHKRQIAEHGGSDGIRDMGLLSSALARPQNLLAYSEKTPDISSLAAAYAFGITKNHPFIDGNKRTALVVMRTFLLLNGCSFVATQEEKYLLFLKLAEGNLSEDELGNWIREKLTE
ncbi:MAG: type II toxin-antitoxin system death-on-curing family toxin [Acidobacteria bacterium]|nr:type II toxin-antitoxin system death-on-curing family toxin [Acidobacteriota bacterium]MCA1638207.1 type II toxin-antitoxin system death-on-curing family toxin [Acidobacteriota bacterium]